MQYFSIAQSLLYPQQISPLIIDENVLQKC